MHTTVDVQHFPGYIASLRQVDDRIGDFLCVRDRAHRGQGLLEVLWHIFHQRCVDHTGRDRVETDALLGVFTCEAKGNRVQAPFGHHRNRRRNASDGVLGQCCGNARNAATCALCEHLLNGELSDHEKAFQVRRDHTAKVLRRVVSERLRYEDACTIHEMIDRTKLTHSGLYNVRGGRNLTDVAIDEGEVW